MAERWATFGIDLHLDPTGPGLRRGLTDALREAVRTGRLAPGTRLPSSRSLAGDLGIARNTVADAYADLVAEGWLTARQGSGTRVADRPVIPPPGTPVRPRPESPAPPTTWSPAPPTSRRSRARSGCGRPAAPSSPPPTSPSGTAIHAAAPNCAPRSPATSPAPGAYAPTPSTSWCAPASCTA